jgi:hypothetical protein
MQTASNGDRIEKCRLGANEQLPFACPEGCVLYEKSKLSQVGWHMPDKTPKKRD